MEEVSALFVSASGNDASGGLTEEAALRTLSAALAAAKAGDIKRILVLGTLTEESEAASAFPRNPASVFYITDAGEDEILITGPGEAQGELSAEGTGKRVITVEGGSRIRFENIGFSGGTAVSAEKTADGLTGGGLFIHDGARVTLGRGARVVSNTAVFGGGAAVWTGARLVLEDGGLVSENRTAPFLYMGMPASPSGGGVYVRNKAEFIMNGGEVSGNAAHYAGGGVDVEDNSTFTMTGGALRENSAGDCGG
ncbi:MAG: hypothetical protein LBT68_08430, partial [Spirochaetales bacterium]|nr:hypothetical protein [Spirochaetales bacterium]